ncbi:MAG: hypothetical protein JNL70_27335 [Saprospiraceae bacterium]|nr:hypothetical protein [Saprospiraceae bacterium]
MRSIRDNEKPDTQGRISGFWRTFKTVLIQTLSLIHRNAPSQAVLAHV